MMYPDFTRIRPAPGATMQPSPLKLQCGFWALVFLLRQLPGTLAEHLTGDSQLVFNLMWAATGLALGVICHRWLIVPCAGAKIALWRWVACATIITAGLLLPALVMMYIDGLPIGLPGLGDSELFWLLLAMRGADAAVPAVAWCMASAAALAVSRAAWAESQRLGVQLELERQAKLNGEFRLAALQARVHPHFLFNAMNTIRALIAEQPERARQAVTDLAFLIRQTLVVAEAHEHPVEAELRIVEAYLALQQLRFGERLRWRIRDERNGRALHLPPLLLQTLVENAVVHGVGRQTALVAIDVRIGVDDTRAVVEVVNTGPLVPARDGGRGLAVSRERLRLLYGDDSALILTALAGAVHARAAWAPLAHDSPADTIASAAPDTAVPR
jgi:hypothetical protein